MEEKILEIKKYPDAVLRKRCVKIEKINPQELALFKDMLFTMRTFKGIGLAAPQVGKACQIIVADIGDGPIKLANPRVLKKRGEDRMAEGCLSIPNVDVTIKRSFEVLVEGLNEKGELVEVKAKGLLARVLLHEIDHLRGRLIIDHLGLLEKMRFFKTNRKTRNSLIPSLNLPKIPFY